MKTRRILAASTAALLSFASVAVVANATFDADDADAYEEFTKDGIDVDATGLGCTAITKTPGEVSVSATVKDVKKFDKYAIQIGLADPTDSSGKVDAATDFSGLTAKQQAEVAKLASDETVVLKVALAKEKNADGDLVTDSKAPAPITFTISGLKEDVNVYHVGDKTLEKVKVTMDATIGAGKTATFEAQNFSDFIITKGEIKKGLTTADDADDSNAATSDDTSSKADGTTSPDTGIALAIAPVVLAAGAVAVVALKKKH